MAQPDKQSAADDAADSPPEPDAIKPVARAERALKPRYARRAVWRDNG